MNRFIIFVAALLSIVSAGTSGLDWRIVGGSKADDGQFPYQISLRNYGGHNCGGAIINKNWILTAAHCVVGITEYHTTVVVGSNKLDDSGVSYLVEKFIYHSDFDYDLLHNDIALVQVRDEIKFNAKVQPISLNTKDIGVGENLVLSGWGRTAFPGNIPDDLHYINLKSIGSKDCNERHQSTGLDVGDKQLCTYTQKGEGSCQGDSGGPLAYQGSIAGIVSWGRPCAIGFPDVFTRVSSYIEWINENMK